MLVNLLIIIISLAVLAYAAERFVFGASALADHMGISPLLIGLTIVAFGTSAPEIFVAVAAALDANTGLAVGNAIGSNIANIGLVLGAAILFAPKFVHVDTEIVKREMPIMLVVTVITSLMFVGLFLSRLEGLMLIAGLIAFIIYAVMLGKKQSAGKSEAEVTDIEVEALHATPVSKSILLLLGGLIFMALSSKTLVWSATNIAHALGVSDLIIGLTIVAIGTSLPEVAASVASALKNKTELAVGNILGSNIFNLLAVVGVAAVINPTAIEKIALYRDVPVMLGLSFLLLLLIRPWNLANEKNHHLYKISGLLLLASYIAYMVLLLLTAKA